MQAAAAAGADMGTVNLSLSELVTGGPGLDSIHEAHHAHHHQMPVADLPADEETAEDEVLTLSQSQFGSSSAKPLAELALTACGRTLRLQDNMVYPS